MKRLRSLMLHILTVLMVVSQLGAATIPAYAASDDGTDPVITDQAASEVTSETETPGIGETTGETEMSSEDKSSEDKSSEGQSSEEQEITEPSDQTEETIEASDEASDGLSEETDVALEGDSEITEEEEELLGSDGYLAIDVINFPDAYFRAYVRNEFDKNGDQYLEDDERKAATKITLTGDLSNPRNNCTSVKGIEHFWYLRDLHLYNTKVESVDLSRNSLVDTVIIYTYSGSITNPVDSDYLKELDLSRCKELDMIKLPNNTKLTKLYTPSSLPSLTYLELDHTGIT